MTDQETLRFLYSLQAQLRMVRTRIKPTKPHPDAPENQGTIADPDLCIEKLEAIHNRAMELHDKLETRYEADNEAAYGDNL
jgi:hypothetical protein